MCLENLSPTGMFWLAANDDTAMSVMQLIKGIDVVHFFSWSKTTQIY